MRRGPFGRFPYRRRGPFGRPIRPRGPLLPGRSINPRVQRELRRANHLMSVGEHLNAAEIFLRVANKARDLGIIYPAPMLLMQAAHANLLGESFEPSVEQARAGLGLLADQERWHALKYEGERYIEGLESAGRKQEGQELSVWLHAALDGKTLEPPQTGQLPEKCPYCGATFSLEQIQAGGNQAAQCQYCGSVVQVR